MGMTRDTKTRRLTELEGRIEAAQRIAAGYADRAAKATARAESLAAEREWLLRAPVLDPLPESESGPRPVPDA